MPIEIAGIRLERIHKINTLEQADFVSHRIPGLEGNVVQNMGRNSVCLQIEGIFYGDTAQADMEALRDKYKAREPVDFLAEIVGQAYFARVILERFEVAQSAEKPGQLNYILQIAEHVVPPEPEPAGFPDVDTSIADLAQNFMDIVQLPDILAIPGFGDPTAPLSPILDGVRGTLSSLTDSAGALTELFGEE